MNLPTLLVLAIVVVCFVAALVFICKNGGFGGECSGDCSSCAARCEAARQNKEDGKH
ncbi:MULTISPECIES: FeoB-associated Cys-rich membrane protein [Eubacteriales]|uniref:FeoB-associated Cys-rich membrane protein n=1 Tax=Allofournierella massiliensis TaxID=1650663 RepID=A0ABT7UM96_9FIRM|nr:MULTISPECIES: FeoB-associated Cys-rich membrane protein [Eubacteriales]MDM8199825.1 FeoB-associated Cys-rich membrane protein [Fournierella massiliensis]